MTTIEMDERSVAAHRTGGYYAYLVMSWALVGVLALRGLRPDWAPAGNMPVDVLAVLGAGALTHACYVIWRRAAGRRTMAAVAVSVLIALIAAAAIARLGLS